MTSVADPAVSTRAPTTRGLVLVDTAWPVDRVAARFPEADSEACAPAQLAERVRDARKEARPFVGFVGDDRDLRIAAEELAHGDTAMLVIDPPDAALARAEGAIDLGRVNGQCFVRSSRLGTHDMSIVGAVRMFWRGPRLAVQLDGRPAAAWSVFVGNGTFGPGVDEHAERASIDEHVLDVRIVRADGRLARLRFLVSRLLGRALGPREIERRTCTAITIDGRQAADAMDVVLDGATIRLSTPLRYESDAAALRVTLSAPAPRAGRTRAGAG